MKQHTFVILSTTDWDAPQFGSRQQIARRLARRHQVLYIEQPRALHSLISDRSKTLRQLRRWLKGGLRRPLAELPNLQVYAPPPVWPIFYHPWTNRFSQRILAKAIRATLHRLNWPADIFWTYWANSDYLVGRLGQRLSVYHCIDNFRASGYPLVSSEQIAAMENRLCQKVDLVLARTAGLVEMLKPYSRRIEWLPGGVDIDLFCPQPDRPCPPPLSAIPQPIAGLVGSLDNRLDVALLKATAQRLPQVSFVLAGFLRPHLVDLSALLALPNVHLLPAIPHQEVPAYLAQFTVGLIPYLVNDYTRQVSPLKLYEFLAMAKPVVATPLPYLQREEDKISLAATADEFIAAIEQAITQPPSNEQQTAWRQAAGANSWAGQVDTIEEILTTYRF